VLPTALQRIDSHCHVWDLSRGDYGWLDVNNTDLKAIARNFDFNDLQAVDQGFDAARYVVVQAAPTVPETQFLLSLAENNAKVCAVVGWVDLSAKDALTQLSLLSENPKFKGVRPMLQNIADSQWINTAPQVEAVNYLVEAGLTFDALVLPRHLSALLSFSVANPTLPIVIDHAAKPALSAASGDERHAQWREGMALLAAETNAYVKLSGLLTELSIEQCSSAVEILRPVVNDLLEWFGPDRISGFVVP